MKTVIAYKYHKAVVVPHLYNDEVSFSSIHQRALIATFSASLMQLGCLVSNQLAHHLTHLTVTDIGQLYKDIIPVIQKSLGADVSYVPMYPNFPKQVMEADDIDLFLNAMLHYWSEGKWIPDYEKLSRPLCFDDTVLKELGAIDELTFLQTFTTLLSSNDSISVTDKETVSWFIGNYISLPYPDTIPFKENMACVAGMAIASRRDISQDGLVRTTTDLLRVAVSMSGGDVSLATSTKFRSHKRYIRKALVSLLEDVITAEDVNRHRNTWIKLFHNLHVGDYSKKVFDIAQKVRDNKKIETFNGKVQLAIDNVDITAAVDLLKTRPGDFARRLDHLLRLTAEGTTNILQDRIIVSDFFEVVDGVSTRVLLQLIGHFKKRASEVKKRIVFPKGSIAQAIVLRDVLPPLRLSTVKMIIDGIHNTLTERFASLDSLGKVWIDPALVECPLPTGQRSASEGTFQVARGTRLPIGDNNTLRFFIYWKGRDIDLSATFHDENFKLIGSVSYRELRNSEYDSYHSGDIVDAPNGACEFIDVTIDSAAKTARYVAMNVLVYSGPSFSEHEICYAGWMTRDSVDDGEVFEPKTVEQKIDLTSTSSNSLVVLFDLVERKAIWTDMTMNRGGWGCNNVENNMASIDEAIEAIVSMDNKVSLYELFALHADARGTIVDTKEEADTVFSLTDGIGPYDISTINADFIK